MDFEHTNMDIDVSTSQSHIKVSEKVNAVSKSLYDDSKVEVNKSEMFDQIWNDDFGAQMTEIDISVDATELPLVTDTSGEKVFRFYWWDAFEDPYKQPGMVHLFGKVYVESAKTYVSCCLTVKNIERRLYLLPRKHVRSKVGEENEEPQLNTITNVYEEFNQYANKNGITKFRSNKVSKYYAFEREGVPKFSEYLEVRYSATYPPMDPDYVGDTIEHVFGISTNALELMLIERNIKGPCWLDVKRPLPVGGPTSWCKIQVNCLKMENISVCLNSQSMPPPPMVIATLNIRTALNTKLQCNEIVMVAILLQHKYQIDKVPPKPLFDQHFCLITNPRDTPWPLHARDILSKNTHTNVIRCNTELDLLQVLLEKINKVDPDLLVGYDCGFQFDVLMHRMFSLKVPNWSKMGKLKRTVPSIFKGKVNLGQVFCGRPICDIQNSAKELNLKVRSYDLQTLCITVLKKQENECKEVKPGECSMYYSKADKIDNLLRLTMLDALYILTIMFELNVMPLALQITCIAGNILSRTLSAGRAERNEYLLLHAFYTKGYITPDKRNIKKGKGAGAEDNSRRKKAAYTGGLVLEPKKGFYDKLVLLMDFNSLYPSIIQEYNLCFTTVPGAAYANNKDLSYPKSDLEPGVVPTEIRKLVESRTEVKKLMKSPNISPELKIQYNIRQMALKLTANSMYGCLGAAHCRFYAKGLAALVTAKGREILQNTKHLVEKLNYEVIYGDTDSLMINTNILDYDEVFAVGRKIKQEVNKLYKRVELDIDGVFRYLLLLQKKKYAAVTMTKLSNGQLEMVQEHKGLDIVRRDWCQLACETGKNILDQLLCEQPSETRLEKIINILQNVSKAVREGQVHLSSLVITKQLSKNPNDYPDKKQPHVIVALRLNSQGGRMWKAGDTVPYIICEDGSNKSATERAYHIDEFKKSDSLKLDVNYYLLSQIFPVVLRICDPIEGIDDVMLAEHLGLEGVYKSRRVFHDEQDTEIPLSMNEDRFKYCTYLKFTCRNEKCQTEITIKDLITEFPSGNQLSLFMCPNIECDMPPWAYVNAIKNELQHAIRNAINEYYAGWLECENPLCTNKTRQMPLDFCDNHPKCNLCGDASMHRIYSETKLYNQICFYLHIFDLNQPKCKHLKIQKSRMLISAYDSLKECVEKQLRRNAYSVVNLTKLFSNWDTNEQISSLVTTADLDELEEVEDELIYEEFDTKVIPNENPGS